MEGVRLCMSQHLAPICLAGGLELAVSSSTDAAQSSHALSTKGWGSVQKLLCRRNLMYSSNLIEQLSILHCIHNRCHSCTNVHIQQPQELLDF